MLRTTSVGEGQSAVRALLNSEETLLWSGRPLGGVRFQKSDLLKIPFSLMWGGFAIFWEVMVIRQNAPLLFKLWGIPFVCVGLYLIFGRFLYDAYVRERTTYAITNARVLILRNGKTQSLPLATLQNVRLETGPDGVGTIELRIPDRDDWRSRGWPADTTVTALAFIPSAAHVYELLMQAVQAR